MITATGFMTVLIASAFLDGEGFVGALIACAVGTAMMLAGRKVKRWSAS